ncbi:MAG: PAS domain S-box protein [Isosphaeraceae bacterium]|nr:PAS domain S-box protein [Isosphaeraceae bacterium]
MPYFPRDGSCSVDATEQVADHLDRLADDLIGLWREAVRRNSDVPSAASLSRTELIDHLPMLLDRMAQRLRGRPADIADAGQQHGRMRWRLGYDIVEVVSELGLLRSVLIQATFAYARDRSFDGDVLECVIGAINQVLDEAIAESVGQFHEESQAATQAVLAEAEARRRAVEDARISAEADRRKLRTILESLPIGVWVLDAQGVIIGINREGERLQGLPAEEVVGQANLHDHRPYYHLFRPDGTEYGSGEIPAVRALQGEVIAQEEMIWQVGERAMLISVSAAPLLRPTGEIAGAVVVVQDVTERKRLEAELADSQARFRTIAEHSPVIIWRSDATGLIDYVNQTYLDFRGQPAEQELGEGWVEGVHPDDRDRALTTYHTAFARREPFALTFRLRRRDGLYRWLDVRGTPYYGLDSQFLGYLGSCIDVTERVELEELLRQQREMAEESSKHKTRLLSALSHDARTPLNAVVLSAQLLEMHIGPGADDEVAECLRTIRHSVRNVLDLLGDLLNLSKIDAGALPVQPSRFELVPALAECLASIETQARQKGLDCRLEPGPLTGLVVETDRAKLKQILCNLLSNALRFTERGRIRLWGERTADQLRIAVEDTGIGIAPADQARVFEEFATLDNPHRPIGEGTGLGLAICRRLANLLKGQIELVSTPGQGSTFTLVLPASVLAEAPDKAAAATTAEAPRAGAILVAEDHLASRQTLGKVLRRMGYRVLEAGNGRDALALARQERPLAILMDVNMPVMDGIDATLALRADPRTRDVPVFALTGDVSLLNQRRIGEAGIEGYLEKPVTYDALVKALASLPSRSR